VEVRRCEQRGQRMRGQHPDVAPDQYGATAHRVGPRVKAAAHTMHYGMGVPVRKLPTILREFAGIVRELIPADYAGVMVTDRGKSHDADAQPGDFNPLTNPGNGLCDGR
jgi:hypothetical protein